MEKGDLVENLNGECYGYVMCRPYNGLLSVLPVADVEDLISGLAKVKYAIIRDRKELKVIGNNSELINTLNIRCDNGYTK